MFQMPFKYISYLELWRPFCSKEQIQLCNFSRGYHEEELCEITLNLDQRFRRIMSFKVISYLELWWSFCLAERNHLCNCGRCRSYFEFGPVVQMSFKDNYFLEL